MLAMLAFFRQRKVLDVVPRKVTLFIQKGTHTGHATRIVAKIQRFVRQNLLRKRTHVSSLYKYWQSILDVYQEGIRASGRGMRSKNPVVSSYKVIKAISEYSWRV